MPDITKLAAKHIEALRELASLREQLAHLQSQAGPDSCADMAARCNAAEKQLAAERAKRAALVAKWRRDDANDVWSNAYSRAADELAALDQEPADA